MELNLGYFGNFSFHMSFINYTIPFYVTDYNGLVQGGPKRDQPTGMNED